MDVKSAAIRVLQQAGTALHAKDIAKRSIDSGLWKSKGKTPGATVSSQLGSDIRKKGSKSAFVKTGASRFALRDSFREQTNGRTPKKASQHQKSSSPNTGLPFIDCAEKVLKKFGDKKPMHYKRITEKALEEGWLVTSGKTPENTLYAQVFTDIKRREERGAQPRFVRGDGPGLVGLAQWTRRDFELSAQIEQNNREVQKTLRKRLLAMDPGEFEGLIQKLLSGMGFVEVKRTKLSRDGGIDVRGNLVIEHVVCIKMAVQVKRWSLKRKVQPSVVRDVRGSLSPKEHGLIITTGDFTAEAKREADLMNKAPIALMDGEQLVVLLMKYGTMFLREYGIHVRGRLLQRLFEIKEESE